MQIKSEKGSLRPDHGRVMIGRVGVYTARSAHGAPPDIISSQTYFIKLSATNPPKIFSKFSQKYAMYNQTHTHIF